VDAAERLADYLAGELDADERAALEAELARDAGLRARLDAMRGADTALTWLRSPEPPAGFETRLRDRLGPVLEGELARSPAEELASADSRARQRSVVPLRRRWIPATIGAAAAGLLVLGGIGVVLSGGFGSGDDSAEVTASGDAAEPTDDEAAMFDAAPEAAEEAEEPAEERLTTVGPVLSVSDRVLTPEDVDALLDQPELTELTARELDPDAGGSLAAAWDAGLIGLAAGGLADEPSEDAPAADGQAEADADTPDAQPPAAEVVLAGVREPEPAELAALDRCLGVLIDDAPEAIATYVEVADLDGRPALVIGLVTIDPATTRYTRAEIWALDRSTCEVLRFVQR
jgi:anti-sigma factor RsiW